MNIYATGPITSQFSHSIENTQIGSLIAEYLTLDLEAITQSLQQQPDTHALTNGQPMTGDVYHSIGSHYARS